MASSVVKSAAQEIGRLLWEEAKYLYGVSDKVEDLQKELEWMQCFLQVADEMQQSDAMVRKWISHINGFAYESEDILETFLFKVSSSKSHNGILDHLKWVFCLLRDAKPLHQVGSDIDALILKISKLTSRMKTYGVKPRSMSSISNSAKKVDELRQIAAASVEDHIYGFDEDTEILIDELVYRTTKVVGIHGIGGSGKTTLATKVYHDKRVRCHFSRFSWAYVSQNLRLQETLQTVLLELYSEDKDEEKMIQGLQLADLVSKVRRTLQEKKCLVVLDDLWETKDWDCLQRAFPIENPNSRVMITSRNKDVLSYVDPKIFAYEPSELRGVPALSLLKKRAFLSGDTPDDHQKELLGKELLDYCRGHPLAIVVVGGILASKRTFDEWNAVLRNIKSILKGKNLGQSDNLVLEVLGLSYYDLPYHLKPCFLHLGNFPEDSEISTKKLYRMWIAEGIVTMNEEHGPNDSLEDVASCYLSELVQRSMVQVGKIVQEKKRSGEKIKTCRLHDFMRDFIMSKAEEENFLTIFQQGKANEKSHMSSRVVNGSMHRLAIHMHKSDESFIPSSPVTVSHVRSIIVFQEGQLSEKNQVWLKKVSNSFEVLRVLDLENFCLEHLPRQLGSLIHLRYLNLRGSRIRKLPLSLGNLTYLQTLDLRVCPDGFCVQIPNVLWKMKRLRHLYLPSDYKIKWCQKLQIHSLIYLETLENLDTRVVEMQGLRELTHMKKLAVKDEISEKETLMLLFDFAAVQVSSLHRLYLKICSTIFNKNEERENPDKATEEKDQDIIPEEREFQDTATEESENQEDQDIIGEQRFYQDTAVAEKKNQDNIAQEKENQDTEGKQTQGQGTLLLRCQSIYSLNIRGKMSIPLAHILPENLVMLGLKDCELKADPIPILGKLPKLKSLSLDKDSFLGKQIDCKHNGFPELTCLKLAKLKYLEHWKVEGETMPNLRSLEIHDCRKLKKIPEGLPLRIEVICRPCILGIDRYETCPHFKIKSLDVGEDFEDIASRYGKLLCA